MSPGPILSVRGLTQAYRDTLALDDVSLDVAPGEFIALLGPSGCGKTTLLRAIGGFVQPTRGDISIDGVRMTGVPPYRRPVNTVFQSYALFPHLTIEQNVAYGPKRAGVAPGEIATRVRDALDMVGLSAMGARYPAQLSGGQQQRIALARAIVNRPRLLLLDEPLGALDLKLRRQMQIELKKLQKQLGIAFVFVTHDQEEALVMADRVAVMNAGRIEQVGSGEEIYDRPATEFVADFIGEANLVDVDVRSGALFLAGRDERIGDSAQAPGRYRLLARPEKLRPVQDAATGQAQGAVTLDVTVARKIFVGDAVRLFLLLPGGAEIAMKLPSDSPAAASGAPGDTMRIELAGEPRLFGTAGFA